MKYLNQSSSSLAPISMSDSNSNKLHNTAKPEDSQVMVIFDDYKNSNEEMKLLAIKLECMGQTGHEEILDILKSDETLLRVKISKLRESLERSGNTKI